MCYLFHSQTVGLFFAWNPPYNLPYIYLIPPQLTTLPDDGEFDERTATWDNTGMDDLPDNAEEIATTTIPQEQPGITPIVVSKLDFVSFIFVDD